MHVHHESIFPSQSAVGWDYQAQLAKHESQKDAAKGFGGRYGVQKERQDKVLADTMCVDIHECAAIFPTLSIQQCLVKGYWKVHYNRIAEHETTEYKLHM